MLGASAHERAPLDHYPTPARATEAFLEVYGDDLEGMCAWEPFCGNGAISKVIEPHVRSLLNTDIAAYAGFDADLLVDFFTVNTPEEKWTGTPAEIGGMTLREIADAAGKLVPDAIISNPPYGKLSLRAIEHALKLMEPEKGFVAFLLRKEFDSAKRHRHVFRDHPAFSAKIDLLHRPRWIANSDGAPRHNYSWYVWTWTKALTASGLKPELHYAG